MKINGVLGKYRTIVLPVLSEYWFEITSGSHVIQSLLADTKAANFISFETAVENSDTPGHNVMSAN